MNIPRASWLLAACMGAIINASSVLEVDLVFPRNETYAPTEWFPIVFAFQNPKSAKYLNFDLSYNLWNLDDRNNSLTRSHDLRWANWSSHDPYFAHEFLSSFRVQGRWKLDWSLSWQSCDEYAFEHNPLRADMIRNTSTKSTWFTIQDSAPTVDLVAATANKSCPGEYGVAIDVTDKTMQVPMWVNWAGGEYTDDTCAVVASSPTPTPDPCRVDIDSTIVASMTASLKARLCDSLNPPADCPKVDESAAQQLAVFSVSCLLTAFGALGFFLM
ncbi:hypothetical protein CNMCM6106_007766 [Aspergillus hiratsukae]|uniref:DUF7136 domain-containing protein n=1 Tax=Aspergillus hiratsukae TaxID=1194566 RepID=A0A8H6V3A1_9EURO|nr:hypothetical protein CNMCM6106_007766 [Aspergillus hiratsukae]